MKTALALLTGAHVAGAIVILIGILDAWAFHASFGIEWDKGLILAGAVWVAGVSFPGATTALATAIRART